MNLTEEFPSAKSFVISGRDTACLCLHGFTSTPNIFHPLAAKLSETFGWEIDVPLLPGHGLAPDQLNHVSHQDWLHFSEEHFLDLANRFPKIHLLGLSMGGTLCAHLASKYPSKVKSITLFAPGLYVRRAIDRILLPLIRFLPDSILEKYNINKKNQDLIEKISYRNYSLKAAKEFSLVCRTVKAEFNTQLPTLIFSPTQDQTIHPKSSIWFLKHSHNPKSRIVELQRSPHVVFLGEDNEIMFSETEKFLKSI
jgi:carboxylesterase